MTVRHVLAFLPRLIAAVLLMQTAMAPAHCLAHAVAAGLGTVICTEDGQRIVHVTADGDLAPDGQQRVSGFCAACHALPASPVLAVPALPPPAWVAAPPIWHASAAETLPGRARAPPFEPTGPPAHS